MEENNNGTPIAYILPKGFETSEEFIELWNECYMFIAKGNVWPMVIFTDTPGTPVSLHKRAVSICNGYWKPRDNSTQSKLLSFIMHEGVSIGGSFEIIKTEGDGTTLFNVMTQEDGKGDILVVLPPGKSEFSSEEQDVVDFVLQSLKEYLKTVPVEQPTLN